MVAICRRLDDQGGLTMGHNALRHPRARSAAAEGQARTSTTPQTTLAVVQEAVGSPASRRDEYAARNDFAAKLEYLPKAPSQLGAGRRVATPSSNGFAQNDSR